MANKIYHKHFTLPFFFFILTLFVLESFTTRTGKCTKKERQALLHFKSYIHYDPEGRLTTWTPGEEEKVATNDCCYWSGVTCNNQSRVTSLDLRYGILEGKISPSLLNLSYLNYLDLYDNVFNGKIPMFIGSMTQLRYLNLGLNHFHGTIPSELGNLTNLQELSLEYLSNCTIENLDWMSHLSQLDRLDMSGISLGKVDNWVNAISSLKKLSSLYLDRCDLSHVMHPYSYSYVNSSFSSSIVSLSLPGNNLNSSMYHWLFPLTSNALVDLDLSGNMLDGIPKYLGNLCGLTYLYFNRNLKPIKLPDFLSNLSGCSSVNLQYLGASSSQFTGSVSDDIQNFSSLQWLILSDNQLDGTISDKVWQLPKLEILDVASNFLKGAISENIEKSNISTSNALVTLDLSNNMLDGIPKYLGNLCGLTSLSFSNNLMPIKLPDFLSNLSGCTLVTLQYLDASSSQFTRSLSDDIQNFSSLHELDLSNNQLDGTISEKVWLLPKLQRLDVSSNFLKGAISENIEKSNILYVYLSNNSLQGVHLDAHMSNISSIEDINLSSCKLGPHFPKWIQTMKNLSGIDLSNTQISDNIPEDFWKTWPSRLTYLNISFNNITGIVTDMLSNFVPGVPSTIDLSSNNFYGHIPNAPSRLASLDLSKNNLSGQIFFLCQIVDGYLSFLDLSHNAFTGPIPDCLWNFKTLQILSLGYNNLSGRLPTSIKFLINLKVLYICNNSFSGKLPLSLKNLTHLTFLNLGANKFSGNVPGWIGERLSRLYALILTSNTFIGTIPSHLCQLEYLQILDLSMNKLQGVIPSCLGNLTSMVQDGSVVRENVHILLYLNISGSGVYVDRSMIKWQGSLREFSNTLGFVKIINLSSNNLTGKIPDKLTDLHKLIALDLSMNALVGEIPSNIGEMKELQILDLSRNNLRGGLPSSMSQMTLLNYLDVSYNNLSGKIPSSTQLQSFEPSRYIGNAGLCGLPLPKYCPGEKELEGPPVTSESMDDGEGRWFYIGGATGFVTGFWMVCIALIVNRRGRHAFFHVMNSLENWVYVKVMVFIAKVRRV